MAKIIVLVYYMSSNYTIISVTDIPDDSDIFGFNFIYNILKQ